MVEAKYLCVAAICMRVCVYIFHMTQTTIIQQQQHKCQTKNKEINNKSLDIFGKSKCRKKIKSQ